MLIKCRSCLGSLKIDAALNVDAVLKAIKKGSVSAQVTKGSIFFKTAEFNFKSLN